MKPLAHVVALGAFLTSTSLLSTVIAIDLDPTNTQQLKDASKEVATELLSMYANPQTKQILSGIPGLLTYPPYYWWEAGAMFGQLIDYWYYTGDSQWNDVVRTGIINQIGDLKDFMPANQSKDEGNDDQLFWAFTVMSAAEYNFPAPPDDQPGWLALAQSVFNQLATRWDSATCGGGLRWQIYQWLPGWTYKNLASNGGLFQLSARLALYTKNDSYAVWANKAYDWMADHPLITQDYQVYDGMDLLKNCTAADQGQWTYNYGIMIGGAAYMYNYTNGSQVWADRLNGFIDRTDRFRPAVNKSVFVEPCEPVEKCDVDQVSFKAYLARWLAVAAQLAPSTASKILPVLQHSAQAAAQTCVGPSTTSGGPYLCGNKWYWDGYDGMGGVGQQISALAIITSALVETVQPPFNKDTGGTSKGDPGLGTGSGNPQPFALPPITTSSKVGAGFLTAFAMIGVVIGAWWMVK